MGVSLDMKPTWEFLTPGMVNDNEQEDCHDYYKREIQPTL